MISMKLILIPLLLTSGILRADLPSEVYYGSQLEIDFHIPGPFSSNPAEYPPNGLQISIGTARSFKINGYSLAATLPSGSLPETNVGFNPSVLLIDQNVNSGAAHFDISDACSLATPGVSGTLILKIQHQTNLSNAFINSITIQAVTAVPLTASIYNRAAAVIDSVTLVDTIPDPGLHITSFSFQEPFFHLEWTSMPGRVYYAEWSDDLVEWHESVGTRGSEKNGTTGVQIAHPDPTSPNIFFRVTKGLPPSSS